MELISADVYATYIRENPLIQTEKEKGDDAVTVLRSKATNGSLTFTASPKELYISFEV